MKRVLISMLLVTMAFGALGLRQPYAAEAPTIILLSCVHDDGSWQVASVDVAPPETVVPDEEGCVALLNALAPECTIAVTLDQTGRHGQEVLHIIDCGALDK